MNQAAIIDRIYEAGAVSETWPAVLQNLSDGYDGVGGVLFAFGANGSQNWTASQGMRAHLEEFIASGLGPTNPRPARLAAMNYEGFATDLDAFTLEEIEQDPFYTDFLAPRGMGWTAATMVRVPSGDVLAFSVDRAFKKGPFEGHELVALDELRPHLARAALLSSRLDLKRAQAMTAALHAVGLPAAVLQNGGRLYAANPLFEKLIPHAVRDSNARVTLTEKGADEMLADTVARLAVQGALFQSRSIPVPGREDRVPMIFHVLPVKGLAQDIFSRSIALLVVTQVDRAVVPTADVLQGLFDLTPAESGVARAIAEGKAIEAIAAAAGISQETVRKQLGAVFGKTGTHRQAELAALLAGKGIENS